MPKSEWQDWRQVAETFVAERPTRSPDLIVHVLVIALRFARSWAELVGGGDWIQAAAREVFMHDVAGFRDQRTHRLLDRFTSWLHGRGDIDDWQRDVMYSEIDRMRDAYGHPFQRTSRVTELRFDARRREALISAFATTIEDPVLRDMAAPTVEWVVTHVELELGACSAPPMGCVNADRMIRDVLSVPGGAGAADRALFLNASLFYRWLGAHAHLERSRADAIAARFASAAMGVAA